MSLKFLSRLNELLDRANRQDDKIAELQVKVSALEKECTEHAKHLVELIKPEKARKYG